MIFSPLNIEQELIRERIRQQRFVNVAHDILEESIREEEQIRQRLHSTQAEKELHIIFNAEDRERIFSLKDIRRTCIRYRLRFLDSLYFKAEFPYAAIAEIKNFERKYGVQVKHFKLMAPDHAFNLENVNKDPLLFAQLTDNSFYLVHKWGKDLAWYKKYLYLPLQNPIIFFTTLFLICALISVSIPVQWMNVLSFVSEVYLRIWFSIHLFILFTGFAVWAGLAFDKNFSNNNWDSKYYNW
jgi:hypothetical protein